MRCQCCLLQIDDHKIEIDDSGTCTYCRTVARFSHVLEQIGHREDMLMERFRRFRGAGDYDCVAGLSGGKDSSYTLYRLVRHYGVRPLAFTCDNGFLTDYAKSNIGRIIRDLGVDHIWVRPQKQVLRTLYRNNLNSEGWPCSACFYMMAAAAYKIAAARRISYIVTGRTPEQILRQPSPDDFDPARGLIGDNLSPYDAKRVADRANRDVEMISSYGESLLRDGRLLHAAWRCFFYVRKANPFTDTYAPETLSLFAYEVHDEHAIMSELQEQTSWQPPPAGEMSILSHSDCLAHDAAGYLYHRVLGTPFLSLEVASLIRQGKLKRSDGAKRLREELEAVSRYPSESMACLSEVCGQSERQILRRVSKIKLKGALRRLVEKVKA